MKKIRLTESELVSLIEKVVKETQINEAECGTGCVKVGDDCVCDDSIMKPLEPTKLDQKSISPTRTFSKSSLSESYKQGYRAALREMRNRRK